MKPENLEDLYRSIEEAVFYGIGTFILPGRDPVAYVHVHYPDWPRDHLELVRESFAPGLVVRTDEHADGTADLIVATREQVTIQTDEDGETFVLRGPAWDVCLENVDRGVLRDFDALRRRRGGFFLLLQTPAWEFPTSVPFREGRVHVGDILPRVLPMPPAEGKP
jgi:hypothetical protein